MPVLIAALLDPPPSGTLAFCQADVNADGAVDGLDVQPLVDLLLSGAVCPPPVTGACCFSDQSCLQDTLDGCFFAGGLYQGDGIDCAGLCQLPAMGACCLADGICLQTTEAACLTAVGIYQGDSSMCTPNLCPQPLFVECCLGNFNSDGIVDTLDVPGFVAATLNPPPPDTPDLCLADINLDLSYRRCARRQARLHVTLQRPTPIRETRRAGHSIVQSRRTVCAPYCCATRR